MASANKKEQEVSISSLSASQSDMKQKYFSIKAGDIRLQVNRKEDIFFADDVPLLDLLPSYEDLIGIQKIGFGFGAYYRSGTKLEKQTVALDVEDTIISGFYADTLFKEFSRPYKVNIYITYEIEE